MKTKNILRLGGAIIYAELAGIIGSFFTASEIGTWYETLVKPSFNPPSWLFGPVWTILFALMGISLYRIDAALFAGKKKRIAEIMFHIQLVLNVAWSIIFFSFHAPGIALIEILFLLAAIIATAVLAYRVDRIAAWLLVPYILWVSFATILNFAIWRLN